METWRAEEEGGRSVGRSLRRSLCRILVFGADSVPGLRALLAERPSMSLAPPLAMPPFCVRVCFALWSSLAHVHGEVRQAVNQSFPTTVTLRRIC